MNKELIISQTIKKISNITKLKDTLSSGYKLLCCEDIASMITTHSHLYNFLNSLNLQSFDQNDRIVFYTSFELSEKVITHIETMRSIFQIPLDNLLVISKNYGTVLNLENTLPLVDTNIADYNTICPFPFSEVLINQYGFIKPCCRYAQSQTSVVNKDLKSAFFDEEFSSLRSDLFNGIKNKQCKLCWDSEYNGNKSLRQIGIEKMGKKYHQWIDKPLIKVIEISISNLCNFTCRICYPDSSSKIAEENVKFSKSIEEKERNKKILKLSLNSYTDTLYDNIIQNLDTIDTLHFVGGEPFLNPKFYPLIKYLCDKDIAKNIELIFHTNASKYPEKFFDKFKKFKKVDINLSIDNVGKRFEVERGGKWEEVYENCKKFSGWNKEENIYVRFSTTVNIQNLLYLDDVFTVAKSLNLDVYLWCVEKPAKMAIDNITENAKKLAISQYKDTKNPSLIELLNRIDNIVPKNNPEFIEYMEILDKRRNVDSWETHKEIMNAMR